MKEDTHILTRAALSRAARKKAVSYHLLNKMHSCFRSSALSVFFILVVATVARADLSYTFQAVSPTDLSNLSVGQLFDLNVNVTGITSPLFYATFSLASDSSVLQLDGSTPGPIIPIGYSGAALLVNQNSPTTISFGAYGGYSGSGSPEIQPDGLLATLHFTALASGSGSFQASDFSNLAVNGSSPAGSANILAYTVVPEPGVMSLVLGMGLIAVWRRPRR